MAEKELAFISYGIFLGILIIFFSILLYTLKDRIVNNLYDRPSPLTELDEHQDLPPEDFRVGRDNKAAGNYMSKLLTQGRDHDHEKKPHDTQASALETIDKMKAANLPGSDRLNAYYNKNYGKWFVGKSSY